MTRTSTTRTKSIRTWIGLLDASYFPFPSGCIRVDNYSHVSSLNVICRKEPLWFRSNMRQILSYPPLPNMSCKLLHSSPALPWVERCGVNTLWYKVASHLTNQKMIESQHRFVIRDLELSRLSAPMKIVSNSSSFTSAPPSIAAIARLADFIIDSKTPPKCGAAGGFQFHATPLLGLARLD